jgi:hypothetical protein
MTGQSDHQAIAQRLSEAINQAQAVVSGKTEAIPVGDFRSLLGQLSRDLSRLSVSRTTTIKLDDARIALSESANLLAGATQWDTVGDQINEVLRRFLDSVHSSQL